MASLVGYLGVDQYGDKYVLHDHPRKELTEKLGSQHVAKMYVDFKDGHTEHVGYIVAGRWIQVYEVHHWGKSA